MGEEIDEEVLKEVAEMVDTAASELEDALEDNPELKDALEKSLSEIREALESTDPQMLEDAVNEVVESFEKKGGMLVNLGSVSTLSKGFTDSKVLLQLEDAEMQAQQTARTITELKDSVAALLEKPHMTEIENMELEEKNQELADQLKEFELRTRQIQLLVSQIDKKADVLMPGFGLGIGIEGKKPLKDEDMLPKVIICGIMEDNMPKVIICDADKKKKPKPKPPPFVPPPAPSVMPMFQKRLDETYNMYSGEGGAKGSMGGNEVASLNKKIEELQAELHSVAQQNVVLTERINQVTGVLPPVSQTCGPAYPCRNPPLPACPNKNPPPSTGQKKPSACQEKHKKPPCRQCGGSDLEPYELQSRFRNTSMINNNLSNQLLLMEQQVSQMQCDLECVHQHRMEYETRRASGRRCTSHHYRAPI